VWSVVFAPDGQRIFSAGQDRTVRVWPAHTKLLAADLCRVVNDPKWEEPYWTEEMWRSTMPADVPYRPSPCTN
jgi:WD40 repeat protein